METLRRIVYLIFRPKAEWDAIAREQTSVDALLRRYILPLALLAPVATVIGMKTFDRDWDPVHGFLVPAEQILAAGVTTYFATVGSILVLAAIFTLIAPMFGVVARLSRRAQGRHLRRDSRAARRGDPVPAGDGDRHDGRGCATRFSSSGSACGGCCMSRTEPRPSSSASRSCC